MRWDDEFWSEDMEEFTRAESSLAGRHHPRKPDLAMGIRIHMRTGSAWAWQVCYGVYLGRGQSTKTQPFALLARLGGRMGF